MPLGRNALLAMMYLSRLPWLHVEIVRVGGLQAFCIVKYADTIFHLCGTSKGRTDERSEGGSREIENSRRAGFLCYAMQIKQGNMTLKLS